MNSTQKPCWVTRALDNKECLKALVIAKSLKSVLTSGSLVVLVGPGVNHEFWEPLQQEFDTCIHLNPKALLTIQNRVTLDLYVKMYCWKLIKWSKVVYLDPNCLVVRNSDDTFELGPKTGLLWIDTEASLIKIFAAKPCIDVWNNFRKLVTGPQTISLTELECFEKLVPNEGIQKLDRKLTTAVNIEKRNQLTDLDMEIINFDGIHPTDIFDKKLLDNGIEDRLFKLWDTLFLSAVGELITWMMDGMDGKLDNFISPRLRELLKNSPTTISAMQNYPQIDYSSAIAIVGISCRFPGANDLGEFWRLLMEGYDGIVKVPEGRWTKEKCPMLCSEHLKSAAGFLKCKSEEFDGKFFGISPKELAYLDPQQRLTIQVAWEALEDAGIDPTSLYGTRAGVFAGAWRTDYKDVLISSGLVEEEEFRAYMGNSFGLISARLSHLLGLTGPSISTESGCSSSMVAVDLAVKSLQRKESTVGLACGVNLLNYPFTGIAMRGFVSDDSHCKVFDARADGFGRAEGCGVLVLKRYADAVRDEDNVYALIRGSAVTQEGESTSLGTPTKKCEALAMKLALNEAQVNPKDVSYVEAHGTGTALGDPLEVAAICEAYSSGRSEPLTIGSVKANIGHTESCSGIAGIIKIVLSMQNEIIPPHGNFQSLNPEINLDSIPAQLPLTAVEWKRNISGRPRIAGVSSFGVTGTDAHAIIQEPPCMSPKASLFPEFKKPYQVLTLSGKTPGALEQKISQYKQFIETNQPDIQDFSFTANCGRSHFAFRTAVVGKDLVEILRCLEAPQKKQIPDEQPKLCFLFTGQGSQYPGMARSLYESSLTFKLHFDRCDRMLREHHSLSIKEVIWGKNSADLSRSLMSQTSIFVVEYCLLMLWESWGVKPDFVLGHSLGEFAAAVAAGILKFEDALKLVVERSKLIESLPAGKMLVVKSSEADVEKLMKTAFSGSDKWLDFAAFNSNEQTVLAGTVEHIQYFSDFCVNNSVKTHVLEATHAFHSRQMDPILKTYRQVASSVTYSTPNCTFISGMDGRILEGDDRVNEDYWVRHTRDSVRFANASKAAMKEGCSLFLEIGPQPVLSALTMINSSEIEELVTSVQCLPSLRKQNPNWSVILSSLGTLYTSGIPINWKSVHKNEGSKKISIPFYPFQNKPSWYQFSHERPEEIHPLVGVPLSNATTTKIFHKTLKVQNSPFLKDHMIGNQIIFPGAGFLEMCLVAGHAATQCSEAAYFSPTAPITLENFVIEAPLALKENEATQLQAIVTSEDSGEIRVIIYSKLVLDKETYGWIRHASGSFSPIALDDSHRNSSSDETLEKIRLRLVEEEVDLKVNYDSLAEFGLKFGPTFRTLKKMWRNGSEHLFEVSVTDDPSEYICHPVVSDAMLQAIMIGRSTGSKKLFVPFSCNKFISYAKIPKDRQLFIYYKLDDKMKQVKLYDVEGNLLANMMEAILMETTVSAIMSALSAQRVMLPKMYEDVWRSQMGCMERRVDINKCFNMEDIRQAFHERALAMITDEEVAFIKTSDQLCGLYILKGFVDLGFNPQPGKLYSTEELTLQFGIKQSLLKYLRYLLVELEKDGYFRLIKSNTANSIFKCTKEFPSSEQIQSQITQIYPKAHSMSPDEVELIGKLTEKFADCFTGRDFALPILFPDDPESTASLDGFYRSSRIAINNRENMAHFFPEFLKNCESHLQETGATIRILEVGAGTGIFTKAFLPHLNNNPEKYEYTYTDLSPAFFQMGEKIFQNTKIKVVYRVLNIEVDSASQDFIPHQYDLIVANNVIHATRDISNSLRNLRNLLRPSGLIVICETISPCREITLAVGLLDDYWSFTDYDLRPHNCIMSVEKWKSALSAQGFCRIEAASCYEGRMGYVIGKADSSSDYIFSPSSLSAQEDSSGWIIFGHSDCRVSQFFRNKLRSLGEKVAIVTPAASKVSSEYSVDPNQDSDVAEVFKNIKSKFNMKTDKVLYLWGLNSKECKYSTLTRPFLNICKSLLQEVKPVLLLVTNRAVSIGDCEMGLPDQSLVWSMTKSFHNEAPPNSTCRSVDMNFTGDDVTDSELLEVFSELFINDNEVHVAYRDHQRNVVRCVEGKYSGSPLSFPSRAERFRLVLPTSKAIRDLKFGPTDKINVGDNQVEVRVKAYALNFRDVLTVIKPIEEFLNFNTVGIDYSGVITSVGTKVSNYQVGDAVFGFNIRGDAMGSHLVVTEESIFRVPSHMTHSEASTLPAVTATVVQCFLQIAKLTKDDTVLIHTGSGGVGLIAIQVAQHIGATIVTTAGSKRKRAFLRNMGLKHIFHSRNTSFEKDIRKALNGKGVDVVLNSLTSEGFKEASLAACNEGARFIEMSKLNIWTPEEVEALRPDVKYTTVDLSAAKEEDMDSLKPLMFDLMEHSVIKPLPFVRFDAAEVREALMYLQKAKHVGKIVCTMPEPAEGGKLVTRMFNDTSSYLITGGLGGIGFEICKWMIQMGAKTVVLAGRSPPNEKTQEEIGRLNAAGSNVVVLQADVSDYEQCQRLIETIKQDLPALRGIMHAAGVLTDATYENQTWEKYERTLKPKVKGGWNLHTLTQDCRLEHFVMFSSAAASFGMAGQSNHAAANTYLDSLAFYRNSIGLPATTVNWGQWGQVGVAVNIEVAGLKPFSTLQGLYALERALKSQRVQYCVCEMDPGRVKQLFPALKKYVSELKSSGAGVTAEVQMSNEEFWKDFDSAGDNNAKLEAMRSFVRTMIRQILKLEKDDPLSDDENIQSLGMDSLMMIEMKNSLQAVLGKRVQIPVSVLKDCVTVTQISTKLTELTTNSSVSPSCSEIVASEEPNSSSVESTQL